MDRLLNKRQLEVVGRIAGEIARRGGRAMYAGGVVRDRVLEVESKDVDIEVYGLALDDLEGLLACYGTVLLVGRQFGVLRLEGLEVEWSVPRRDSRGRHPVVSVDPEMSFREASRRRDLTMNAMLRDVLSGELVDPWNGRKDMEQGILRTPDPVLFIEDPLRFYRVMQFTARFEMQPDETLQRTCREMDISSVSRERVGEEFEKMWLLAGRPALGLRWLDSTGRLGEILPELVPLRETGQDPEWHPEGDVWTHTLQVVDAAAALRSGDRERDLLLMWTALLHDIGKPVTSVVRDGRIRAPEHDRTGAEMAGKVLSRLSGRRKLREGVIKLVAEHMKPLQFQQNNSSGKAFKRLALKLHPEADLELLARLAQADYRGTNPGSDQPLERESAMVDWFREMSRRCRVENEPEKPVLLGRHLLDVMQPGPEMGRVLEEAYRIQIDQGLTDWRELKRLSLDRLDIRVDK
ncbi:MAG: CCA tRNA nucleotidyltransferase [Candidatus Glassbacteria bacterium]|nr:CCA tRNA nucleotidyltransferase [Candidatus Glassbacteria bacterium]